MSVCSSGQVRPAVLGSRPGRYAERCRSSSWAGVGRPQAGMIAIARLFSAHRQFCCHIDKKELGMTSKAAFSPKEWKVVLEGPPSAGMIVVTAARGGAIRESIAMSKAYVDARAEHGESELLDEIVAAKPETDHTRYHSAAELRENG